MKYDKSSRICQNCKWHKNKPSRCFPPCAKSKSMLDVKYVNRKAAACPDFCNRWGKTEATDEG